MATRVYPIHATLEHLLVRRQRPARPSRFWNLRRRHPSTRRRPADSGGRRAGFFIGRALGNPHQAWGSGEDVPEVCQFRRFLDGDLITARSALRASNAS
jgi:hypothetical protein